MLSFCHNSRCDGQTDRQTDGRTDTFAIGRTALHTMQRGNSNCCDDSQSVPVSMPNRRLDLILAVADPSNGGDVFFIFLCHILSLTVYLRTIEFYGIVSLQIRSYPQNVSYLKQWRYLK